MKTPARLPILAAAAISMGVVAAVPSVASAKYKECEFSKRAAIKHNAPRCKKNLGKSRWIVVSGNWKEELTVHDVNGDAVFDGKGSATFQAFGLNGNSRFPSRRTPVRSMTSARRNGTELEGSSTGGWRTRSRYYPCGMTIPESWKPNGFGGIFILSGKRVRVQWVIGAIGFKCDTPYGVPSPDFPDPMSSYSLKRFRNKRIVRLPFKFDFTDDSGSLSARVTYKGIARLRRYR